MTHGTAALSHPPERTCPRVVLAPPERNRMAGRDDLLRDVGDAVGSGAVSFVALGGTVGSGRSTLLDAVDEALRQQEHRTVRVRFTEVDRRTPYRAVHRVLAKLVACQHGRARERVEHLLGLTARLAEHADDELTACRLATALSSALAALGPLVVLLDDAHWADDASAALVPDLARRLVGTRCTLVATYRVHKGQKSAVLDAARRSGHALVRIVRRFTARHTAQALTDLLGAAPDAALNAELHRLSAGCPAWLASLAESYRDRGAVCFVDRRAVLRPDPAPIALSHPPLPAEEGTRRKVLRCLAVYDGVGRDALPLAARALGLSEQDVVDVVDDLVAAGVLTDRTGRFAVPAMALAVRAATGPFERRRIASVAVHAWWSGEIRGDDDVLADLLAEAGSLAGAPRAHRELLDRATDPRFAADPRVLRWSAAAASLARTRRQRARALARHCAAGVRHGRMREALGSSRELLSAGVPPLPEPERDVLALHHLLALAACDGRAELARIADGGAAWLPSGGAGRDALRAVAWCLLDRWADAAPELRRLRTADLEPELALWCRRFDATASVLLGTSPGPRGPESRSLLLAVGDGAELPDRGLDTALPDRVPRADLLQLQWSSGRWEEAMSTARQDLCAGSTDPDPVVAAFARSTAIRLLTALGRLGSARELAEQAPRASLAHVVDHAHATALRLLGETDESERLLRSALRNATAQGVVLGTEVLWADLARLQAGRGEHEAAERSLLRTERAAHRVGTGSAELESLIARAAVLGDRSSAQAAVELARRRRSPFECAVTFLRLVPTGLVTDRLLAEAYDLLGELGALLWRARLRKCMQEHRVSVPGRTAARSENDRLLAVLVAEALSNRQIAAVFSTTEKSVEARLTRMFARTGYRSRVELAAALLRRDFPLDDD
ncbi:hypothetical protein GCM10025787_02450 [Saccharopolyspora rosea]|uniref:AAA family ATPase n=1 Tax=Saccharopolyspora rosea TaxID=524884 RepID=A0ABW3FPJ2_9PSEU